MKRIFALLGLSSALVLTSVSADELKNSLTNMLNKPEASGSGMVDLGAINLDGKAKPQKPKTRSANTVIATVNGEKIIKKDADAYLNQRTQGKVKDFDHLPPEQKPRLIQELSLPIIISQVSKKELSEVEKQAAYTRAWTQKEALKIKVSDDEAIEVYNQLKQQSQESNATQEMPPFEAIKERLKLQIIEKQLIERVMKNAAIKVN